MRIKKGALAIAPLEHLSILATYARWLSKKRIEQVLVDFFSDLLRGIIASGVES